MATPQQFTVTHEDVSLARMNAEVRQSRLDPAGEYEPKISGDMLMDLWDINDLKWRPKPNWLIGGFVEEKGLTIFFGPDKVGKTALLSHFLWSWVAHKPYFLHQDFKMSAPHETERSAIYVLLEGQAAFYDRYQTWCDVYNEGEPIDNFFVADDGLSLFEPKMRWDDVGTWTDSAVRLYNSIAEVKPAILVIDTLSRSTAGMNENSPEMAQVVGWLDYVRDTLGTAAILVHHVALAEGDRPRGHSSLKGAASSYVRIEGKPDDPVLNLKSGPHRNAESGSHPYAFVRRSTGSSFVLEGPKKPPGVGYKEQQIIDIFQPGEKHPLHAIALAVGMDKSNLRKLVRKSKRLQLVSMGGNNPSWIEVVHDDEPDKL